MCSILSRFLSKISKTKTEEQDEANKESKLDFLEGSRRVSVLKSVQILLGACFNSAMFIVIGVAVKHIAGPAMLLAVILGAVFSGLNNLSLCELCSRFQSKTSYYAIIYNSVGELCAFITAWLQLLRVLFMVATVSVTVGEYIYYLANPPPDLSWLPPHKMFAEVELDTLVFTAVFLVFVSLIISIGLPISSDFLVAIFWINSVTFVFMFIVIIYYADTLHWIVPQNLQPFKLTGTARGVAVTMFFFTHLDRVIERTSEFKKAEYVLPLSLGVSLLCAFVYFLCGIIFIANLMPIKSIADEATIPKAFASATFYDSKYVVASLALLIFLITTMESYLSAQRALNLLVNDGLMPSRFSNSKKRTTVFSVLLVSLFSIPLLIWLPVISLIQGFCITSLIITLVINCTTVMVQCQSTNPFEEDSSIFPNWQCTKSILIRYLLCCGYITNKKVLTILGVTKDNEPTEQTSKLVNWSVFLYVPLCIGLAVVIIYGLPELEDNQWLVLGTLIFFIVMIFFDFRIILMQPRGISFFFENNIFASIVPLVNIVLSSILVVTLDWQAFSAVGVWILLGK